MLETYKELSGDDQEKIKEIIQQLYRQTFILERQYDKKAERMIANKDFYFCDRHMEFLKAYFAVAGIQMYENTELGTIYIQGETTVGERLPKLATIYLLFLKLIYDEQMSTASTSVNIVTTFGELNGKVGEFRLSKGLSSITEIRRALAILKKYQMIEVIDTLEELNEFTRIIIYPCINVVLMREDIKELLASFDESDEEFSQETISKESLLSEEEDDLFSEEYAIDEDETNETNESHEDENGEAVQEHKAYAAGEKDTRLEETAGGNADGSDETGI